MPILSDHKHTGSGQTWKATRFSASVTYLASDAFWLSTTLAILSIDASTCKQPCQSLRSFLCLSTCLSLTLSLPVSPSLSLLSLSLFSLSLTLSLCLSLVCVSLSMFQVTEWLHGGWCIQTLKQVTKSQQRATCSCVTIL